MLFMTLKLNSFFSSAMPDLLSSCDEMTSNSDKLFIYDTGRISKKTSGFPQLAIGISKNANNMKILIVRCRPYQASTDSRPKIDARGLNPSTG